MIRENDEKPQQHFFCSKPFIYAALFLTGLLIFELMFFRNSEEFIVLSKHIGNGNYLRLFFILLISVASLGTAFLFFCAAFGTPYHYRIIYFLIFALIILNEYAHYKAYKRFSSIHDAEIAFFSTNWKIISNAAAMYFNYLALIPLVVFGFILFQTKPVWKKGGMVFIFVMLATGVFFFATSYFTQNSFYTISFSWGCRTLVNFPTAWYVGSINDTPRIINYRAVREKIEFQTTSLPGNNIVFIIDESVRGDHLSLNGYDKPTTPFLDELNQKNFIKNWGIAVSGTTCSGTSNNLMLTGLTDLPDYSFNIYKMPTIFQYAKAMNYKTYYFDGQVSGLWNGKPSDIPSFGEWIKESELSKNVKNMYDVDGEIARRVKEITVSSTGNFIWINKYGVHKPYTDSYPNSEDATVKDSYLITYNPEIGKEKLKTEYDNAIRYNSQSFFSELFDGGGRLAENTFYVYTSDHGQTLSENGEIASHCSTTKNESVVPLFIIAEPDAFPPLDTSYKASHSNIFATLLDFMNFPESERKFNYSLSLLKAKGSNSAPRFYFSGDLHGNDESKKYPFE